jgi:hypothetical protein
VPDRDNGTMKTGLNSTNVRMFEVVARLKSVTLAAEELETSQPYVSKQIAVMEEQFRVQLFTRLGRRLYLTRAGEMLHLWIQRDTGTPRIAPRLGGTIGSTGVIGSDRGDVEFLFPTRCRLPVGGGGSLRQACDGGGEPEQG